MTSSSDEPDWNLLPEYPGQFFGLTAPYDLVDLRRAYNRLLKRFKPERYPEQFQQIRGAYESLKRILEGSNRYGILWSTGPGVLNRFGDRPTPDVPARDTALPPVVASESGVTDPPLNFVWRTSVWRTDQSSPSDMSPLELSLDLRQLDELLAAMREDASASPENYRDLALRVDCRPFRKREFLKVLLEGLERWPDNNSLTALCGEYFGFVPTGDELRTALVFAANTIRDGHFFQWTAPGWRRLVTELPAREFTQIFAKCDVLRPAAEFDDRSELVLAILAQLMWAGDSDWINSEMSRFDAQDVNQNPSLADRLHQLEVLWMYVRDPTRQLDQSTSRSRFENLIRIYFDCDIQWFADEYRRFHEEIRSDESAWIGEPTLVPGCDFGPTLDIYDLMDWSADRRVFSVGNEFSYHSMDDERLIFALSVDDSSVRVKPYSRLTEWMDVINTRFGELTARDLPLVVLGLLLTMVLGVPVISWIKLLLTNVSEVFGQWTPVIGSALLLLFYSLILFGPGRKSDRGLDDNGQQNDDERYKTVFRPRFLARAAALEWGYRTTLQRLKIVKERVPDRTKKMVDMWSHDFGAALVLTARLCGKSGTRSAAVNDSDYGGVGAARSS